MVYGAAFHYHVFEVQKQSTGLSLTDFTFGSDRTVVYIVNLEVFCTSERDEYVSHFIRLYLDFYFFPLWRQFRSRLF